MSPDHRTHHRFRTALLALLALYAGLAYLLMPAFWRLRTARHPALVDLPYLTRTATGLDGDPLNVALVGSKEELLRAMPDAGWFPADPLTFENSLRIVKDSLVGRPYPEAPVSRLYLFGRPEDFAFEKPVGESPRQRHHVRFWLAPNPARDGRPLWIGAAIFDERVGLSRETGQVTHVTAPDIDAERDTLVGDLARAGVLASTSTIAGFHAIRTGKNGGGDPWHTDGRLLIAWLGGKAKDPAGGAP